jgi:hypothetical protein
MSASSSTASRRSGPEPADGSVFDFDGADGLLRAWSRGIRPAPNLTVSEWADRHRWLSSRASAEPGRYRTARTPYMREIMDRMSPSDPVQRVVFMKAAQIGATEAAAGVRCPSRGTRSVITSCIHPRTFTSSAISTPSGVRRPRSQRSGDPTALPDGVPGEPAVTLSPLRYHYQHRVELEAVVQSGSGLDAAFATLAAGVGGVMSADRTLGGLCDWVEAEAGLSV